MIQMISKPTSNRINTYKRRTLIGMNTAQVFSMFINVDDWGNKIAYQYYSYLIQDASSENIAGFMVELSNDFVENNVCENPRILLNIDTGSKINEVSLQALNDIIVLIQHSYNAEILWNVTVSEHSMISIEFLLPIIIK
jgi:hypothetical protein